MKRISSPACAGVTVTVTVCEVLITFVAVAGVSASVFVPVSVHCLTAVVCASPASSVLLLWASCHALITSVPTPPSPRYVKLTWPDAFVVPDVASPAFGPETTRMRMSLPACTGAIVAVTVCCVLIALVALTGESETLSTPAVVHSFTADACASPASRLPLPFASNHAAIVSRPTPPSPT